MGPAAIQVDARPALRRPSGNFSRLGGETSLENDALTEGENDQLEAGSVLYLPLEQVVPNAKQPRSYFNEAEIESLATSISDSGVLQPIIVRRLVSLGGQGVSYEIVAGERRYRAAKRAGLTRIPAILKQLSDRDAFQLGLIENVQRSDLNPIEEAHALQRLVDEFGATHGEIARVIGKDRASIANSIRLLKLDSAVQQFMLDGRISAGHGRALLKLEDASLQRKLAEKIIAEGLSVRAAEQLSIDPTALGTIVPRVGRGKAKRSEKSPQVLELEDRLRRVLGTKVSLDIDETGRGSLQINFFSRAEFDRLLERLEQNG